MRTNWGLTAAVGGLAMIGGFIAGCQTYDFEQVEPLSIAVERKEVKISGRTVPPNLMILLDKSDSMDRPENPDLPACQTGDVNFPICGTGGAQRCDENTCPTRLSRLREAINDFLAPSADGSFPFRVGLAAYPIDGQCSPTPRLFVELPNSEDGLVLGTNATNVNTRIQNLFADDSTNGNFGDTETAGGTPTAESLRYLRNNVPGLKDTAGGRSNFVLLLTDGLPNCNSNHPVTPETCQCALADPTQCFASPGNPAGVPDGCLDDANAVGAITELQQDGVTTIVVGLGSETSSGLGPATLDAMGAAGGFPRTCTADAQCGDGDTCDTTAKVCNQAFYQASNGAALGAALREIAEKLPKPNPCRLEFSNAPSEEALIFVKVDGEVVPRSDGGTVNWTFDPTTLFFEFQGAICDQILASTTANPVSVDVAVVQSR